MPKHKLLLSFYASLLLLSLLAFCVHILILDQLGYPMFDHMIELAYWLNALMAIIIFSTLYFFRFKWKDLLGFLYLGASMVKFVVFFIVFYPVYKLDGKMEPLEFSSFFAPYLIGLLLETIYTAKMLNKLH